MPLPQGKPQTLGVGRSLQIARQLRVQVCAIKPGISLFLKYSEYGEPIKPMRPVTPHMGKIKSAFVYFSFIMLSGISRTVLFFLPYDSLLNFFLKSNLLFSASQRI